jgi:hypothetical protein
MLATLQGENTAKVKEIETEIAHLTAAMALKVEELARKTPYDPSRLQMNMASRYLNYQLEAEMAEEMAAIAEEESRRVYAYSRRFAPLESRIGVLEQEISTAEHTYLLLLNKLNLTQSMEAGSGENGLELIDAPPPSLWPGTFQKNAAGSCGRPFGGHRDSRRHRPAAHSGPNHQTRQRF